MKQRRNIAQIEGGLTRDAEYNEEWGLIKFSVAVDGAGRENKETVAGFFDVNVWVKPGKMTAEAFSEDMIAAYKAGELNKGARVWIDGRLNHERWEKDGNKGSRVSIVADAVEVLWSKARAEKQNAKKNDSSSETSSDNNWDDEPF